MYCIIKMMKLIRKFIISFGENKYNKNIKGQGGVSTAKNIKGLGWGQDFNFVKFTMLLLIIYK